MKTSYLHVYLVPTRLLIFRKKSHLHVYLVYTFIQYHGVLKQPFASSQRGSLSEIDLFQGVYCPQNIPRVMFCDTFASDLIG